MSSSDSKTDELFAAFSHLLSFYGLEPDLAALMAELPREEGQLTEPKDLQMLCDRLGLDIAIKKLPQRSLQNLNVPYIALLKGHKAKVIVPDSDTAEQDIKDLRDEYFGHVILLALPRKNAQNTEHMWKAKKIDWFWNPVLSYWPQYAEVLVCSFFINLFAIALPLFTMNVYDRIVPNFATETLQVLTIGIVIAFLFDFLFKTMRAYILERVAARVSVTFDNDLMRRFITLSRIETGLSVGEKSNIFRELQGLRDFYTSKLAPAMVDVPFFLFFALIMYVIAPSVVPVVIVGAIVILAITALVQIPIERMTKAYFSDMQSKSSSMIEILSGLDTINMFDVSGGMLRRWNDTVSRTSHSARQNQFVVAAANNFAVMVMLLVNVFVVYFGVYAIQAGDLSIGGLIAVTILSGRAMAPIMNLTGIVAHMKKSRDALQMIDKLFEVPVDEDDVSRSAKGPFTGKIEVTNVSYQYPDQALPALNHVSLGIEPGEKLGLIGQTGAGKSTLAKVIAGMITPETGSIKYDSFVSDTISPRELSRYIGVVPQKSFFFSGSIRDNILMGAHDIEEAAFERAVKLSGLDLYIEQTGQGFDTEIGEGGQRLSGGQQQAIALARVLARDPSILIFDEPTNGMDQTLEQKILNDLRPYLKDKTFILITHRTSFLPLVDRLVLLTKGQVRADGKRDDILALLGGKTQGEA